MGISMAYPFIKNLREEIELFNKSSDLLKEIENTPFWNLYKKWKLNCKWLKINREIVRNTP